LARFLDKMATSYITFLEDVKGFAWPSPPANNFIDQLVYEKLQRLQIAPSELCTDSEFIRRAYLDTSGRLPRPDETSQFIVSPHRQRVHSPRLSRYDRTPAPSR